jgi:6-pyruvoyltetrahydropterin/6-carboxytetrahydropterin synthase
MLISKEFKFDSAHNLVNYKGKCENLHGHTYRLRVTLKGEPIEDGMIMDFTKLKQVVEDSVIDKLDHSYLNDIIEQSTAENIAQWIWDELSPKFNLANCSLYEIRLWETENSFVTIREED